MALPDLVVGISANNKMASGINSAKSSLSGFASFAKSALNPVTLALAGMTAAAASAGAATYVLAGRISKLAGIADEAKKTGLSGELLQRLEYAADQSGVSVETLTMGVKNLTLAVGKGDEKPFAKLGLSLRELQGLQPDQQFIKVSQAIAGIQTPAARMSAAMGVFGKSGKDMAGLFAGGLNEVNDLLNEAARLGIGVSDEDLAKAAAADDAIQRMKMSFSSLIDKVSITLAPAFEAIANKLTDWMTPLNNFMNGFNALPNKMEYLGQVISAAFDVAFESIKAKWQETLASMTKASLDFAFDVTTFLNPVEMAKQGIGFAKEGLAGGPPSAEPANGLAAAQAKFDALMQQVQATPAWQGPRLPAGGGVEVDKLGPAVADIVSRLEGPFAELKMAGEGMLGTAKINANWLGSVVANAFTGERVKGAEVETKTFEPRLAGAMQRGSAEAYSTIVQAMMRGTKDPVVQATEKQTKELIKHLKPKPPAVFAMIGDFLS